MQGNDGGKNECKVMRNCRFDGSHRGRHRTVHGPVRAVRRSQHSSRVSRGNVRSVSVNLDIFQG